jgi:hypothetical protein
MICATSPTSRETRAPPDHPAEDVAPELIGTHRVGGARARVERVVVLAVDRLARQDRREEGDQREEDDDGQADDGELILPQAPPGVAPEGGLTAFIAPQLQVAQCAACRHGLRFSRGYRLSHPHIPRSLMPSASCECPVPLGGCGGPPARSP